ncbi:MAG: 50S ribosomal protein L34 [Patescibacteria group bacterium]
MEKTIKLKKLKRKRKHGFRNRMKTKSGRNLLKRRRVRGRVKRTV